MFAWLPYVSICRFKLSIYLSTSLSIYAYWLSIYPNPNPVAGHTARTTAFWHKCAHHQRSQREKTQTWSWQAQHQKCRRQGDCWYEVDTQSSSIQGNYLKNMEPVAQTTRRPPVSFWYFPPRWQLSIHLGFCMFLLPRKLQSDGRITQPDGSTAIFAKKDKKPTEGVGMAKGASNDQSLGAKANLTVQQPSVQIDSGSLHSLRNLRKWELILSAGGFIIRNRESARTVVNFVWVEHDQTSAIPCVGPLKI